MSDNVFDITEFVNTFDLKMETGMQKQTDGDDFVYEYSFKPSVSVDIGLTFDKDVVAHEILQKQIKEKAVMKMEQRGKYWFDKSFTADVEITDIALDRETLEATATYKGMNVVNTTNHKPLARFLRWVLRR